MRAVDHDQLQTQAGNPTGTSFESLPREEWLTLFARISDGNERALDRLFELSARKLYGLGLWRTASVEDARDVVQEVFVRVAERRNDCSPSERATRVELKPFASLDADGTLVIRPPDSLITAAEEMVRTDPDRRFRCEAMTGLSVIRFFGPPEQQQRVSAFFDELTAHPDKMTALCASWGRDGRDIEANREGIKGWYGLD